MAADEIDEFLNEQATGVLCLSKGHQVYGVPM
jgi:uncharacterized protein